MLNKHIVELQFMDFEKLKLFTQVADAGSLSRAALIHDLEQSVISRQISSLERQCGGRLFHRTGRGVLLSELGERFLPRARALLVEAEQLENDMRRNAGIPVGEVRIGILASKAHPLVGMLFGLARKRFQKVRLRVFEGTSGQLDEWIATGRIDLAIHYHQPRKNDGHSLLLGRVVACLVGSANDKVTSSPNIRFVDLHKLPLVLPGPPSPIRSTLDQIARKKRVSLSVVMEVDSLSIQKEIAGKGSAYTILGLHSVQHEVDEGRLRASRIINPGIVRPVALSTTPHHQLTLACREIVSLIKEIARATPSLFGAATPGGLT